MITHRELATVLAALRFWQRNYDGTAGGVPADFVDFFAEGEPLDHQEIDDLCMELNTERHPAVFLAGNMSDGYTAFGPYGSWDEAADTHEFEDGWVMTLTQKKKGEGLKDAS